MMIELEPLIEKCHGRFKLTCLCQKRLQEMVQFAKISGSRQEGSPVQRVLGEVGEGKIYYLPPGEGEETGEPDRLDLLTMSGDDDEG